MGKQSKLMTEQFILMLREISVLNGKDREFLIKRKMKPAMLVGVNLLK